MIRRFFLPALALLGLMLVLLSPQTGWLARRQLKMAWLGQGEAEIKSLTTPPAPVATTAAMEAAWKLNTIFDEEAYWERTDLESMVSRYGGDYKPFATELSAEVLRLCAIGERGDSDNAFFPVMRGGALLAMHQDADALKALQLAAKKPRFDSYDRAAILSVYQQVQARKVKGLTDLALPLSEEGERHGWWRGHLGSFLRGAMAYALKRQAKGDLRGAMELRRSLLQLHDMILCNGYSTRLRLWDIAMLTSLPTPIEVRDGRTAVSSGYIAAGDSKPVIGSVSGRPFFMGPNLPLKERASRYLGFLRRHGLTADVSAYERSQALIETLELEKKARMERQDRGIYAMSSVHFMSLWAWCGLLLLTSVIATLTCGLLALALRFTQGPEVAKKGRIGALVVFLILTPLIGSTWYGPIDTSVTTWIAETMQYCYASGSDSEPEPWYMGLLGALERWGSNIHGIIWSLAPVLLTQFIGGIWTLVKRRPLGQGVMGGVWRASIPVSCITLLVWCGGVVWLAKEEARQLARFSRVLKSGY